MAIEQPRESARIYQFVPRARLLAGAAPATRAAEVVAPRLPMIEFGSASYHDAALLDADRSRKS